MLQVIQLFKQQTISFRNNNHYSKYSSS